MPDVDLADPDVETVTADVDAEVSVPPTSCGNVPLVVLEDLPASVTDATADGPMTWASSCGAEPWGGAAPERWYGFVPKATGTYRIDVSGDFNAMFTLYEGCPTTVDAPCLARTIPSEPLQPVHGEYQLQADQLYVVVVDGAIDDPPDDSDAFSLNAGLAILTGAKQLYEQLNETLWTMRLLAFESGGWVPSMGDADRALLDADFQLLRQSVDHMATTAMVFDERVGDGTAGDGVGLVTYWVGTIESSDGHQKAQLDAQDVAGLGLTGAAVDTLANAQTAIDSVDTAKDTLALDMASVLTTRRLAQDALARRSGDFVLAIAGPCEGPCPPPAPCEPTCDGAACGPDGCGGSCGACPDHHACTEGACVAIDPCAPEASLTCGDLLTNQAPNIVVSGPPLSLIEPTGQSPLLYTFESAETRPVQLRVTMLEDAPPLYLYVGELWPDEPQLWTEPICSDDGPHHTWVTDNLGFVEFEAKAGTTYFVTISQTIYSQHFVNETPLLGATLSFDLKVECCVPDCSGKTCGSDGCGGSCGTCDVGDLCYQGSCNTPGSECAPIADLACGEALTELELTMPGAAVLETLPGGCWYAAWMPAEPALALVARYTASADAPVTFEAQTPSWAALDMMVMEGDDCGPGKCIAASTQALTIDAEAGQTYTVILKSNGGLAPPPFALKTHCGGI